MMNTMENNPVFSVKNLTVKYKSADTIVHAVNDVSFQLQAGKTLGLVGETGAGKTTIAKSILRILPDYAVESVEGEIIYDGEDILKMNDSALRNLRGSQIAMIFQDPMTALNPVKTVLGQIAEGYRQHHHCTKAEANRRAVQMLEMVGIGEDRADEYPHQFSGGMKQRVVIAIALACSPDLLIADEPTSALDVTIQAQVMEMIKELQVKSKTAMLLITHDFGLVAENCDYVAVIYAGQIVEYGSKRDLFKNCCHPYTLGLFKALPSMNNDVRRLSPINGFPVDPVHLPEGCFFHPRCPFATESCSHTAVQLTDVGNGHLCRCQHYQKVLESQ